MFEDELMKIMMEIDYFHRKCLCFIIRKREKEFDHASYPFFMCDMSQYH